MASFLGMLAVERIQIPVEALGEGPSQGQCAVPIASA